MAFYHTSEDEHCWTSGLAPKWLVSSVHRDIWLHPLYEKASNPKTQSYSRSSGRFRYCTIRQSSDMVLPDAMHASFDGRFRCCTGTPQMSATIADVGVYIVAIAPGATIGS